MLVQTLGLWLAGVEMNGIVYDAEMPALACYHNSTSSVQMFDTEGDHWSVHQPLKEICLESTA